VQVRALSPLYIEGLIFLSGVLWQPRRFPSSILRSLSPIPSGPIGISKGHEKDPLFRARQNPNLLLHKPLPFQTRAKLFPRPHLFHAPAVNRGRIRRRFGGEKGALLLSKDLITSSFSYPYAKDESEIFLFSTDTPFSRLNLLAGLITHLLERSIRGRLDH
jgi:hypothetical protein